jgi:uncharacterized protein (TIGR02391 family)
VASLLSRFERIARAAHRFTDSAPIPEASLHPFDRRNIHPGLPVKIRSLFDDGHYAEATFAAWKYLDKVVQKHSKLTDTGYKLMMAAFIESGGPIKLTKLTNESEVDEQKGFRFVFAGSVWAIRNPRGHEVAVPDDLDTCLDHLAFASMLIRRLEQAGFA